jgi:uncharacterized protein YbjT (DUF2867 family)
MVRRMVCPLHSLSEKEHPMYVVAGVSGHTGAVVAETLLAKGKPVTVLVRSADKGAAWAKKGAQVAIADLGDEKALTKALSGATGAYLLSPPNFAAADFLADRLALAEGMARAVKASGIKQVVFLSSVAAQLAAGTGPIVTANRAEGLLRAAAPSVHFIRAAYFVENWGSVLGLAKSQGILPFYGDVNAKFSQVSTRDIALAAVDALLAPQAGVNIVELAGPVDVSVTEVAAELSAVLGKPVKAVAAPVEAANAGLLEAGLPPTMATLYAELYAGMAKGTVAFERPAQVTRGATSIRATLAGMV